MVVRTSTAQWHGRVPEGSGRVRLGSQAFEGAYSFGSRFEDESGTNPEELLGAAHASCFSMALSLSLTKAGYTPTCIRTVASVTIERSGNGFAITSIDLATEGEVPGLDPKSFSAHADTAKTTCPISKALAAVDVSLTARLIQPSESILGRDFTASTAAPEERAQVMARKGSERFERAR